MDRSIYDVTLRANDCRWQATKRGNSLAWTVRSSKEEVVQAARRMAMENEPSQLVIYRADGSIDTEYLYGEDACPPQVCDVKLGISFAIPEFVVHHEPGTTPPVPMEVAQFEETRPYVVPPSKRRPGIVNRLRRILWAIMHPGLCR